MELSSRQNFDFMSAKFVFDLYLLFSEGKLISDFVYIKFIDYSNSFIDLNTILLYQSVAITVDLYVLN